MNIVREIEIAASAERVWLVMTEVERWPEWTASVKSVGLLDGKPLDVGDRVRISQPRLPTAVWTVTAMETERYLEWRSIAAGLTSVAGHRLEPIYGGTRVTLSISWSGTLARVISFLFGKLSARYVEMEASGLKRRCEGAAVAV